MHIFIDDASEEHPLRYPGSKEENHKVSRVFGEVRH